MAVSPRFAAAKWTVLSSSRRKCAFVPSDWWARAGSASGHVVEALRAGRSPIGGYRKSVSLPSHSSKSFGGCPSFTRRQAGEVLVRPDVVVPTAGAVELFVELVSIAAGGNPNVQDPAGAK